MVTDCNPSLPLEGKQVVNLGCWTGQKKEAGGMVLGCSASKLGRSASNRDGCTAVGWKQLLAAAGQSNKPMEEC